MVKKGTLLVSLCLALFACATVEPPTLVLELESLPTALVSSLTLEERIAVEDVWKDIRYGRAARAEKQLQKLGPASPVYFVGMGYVRTLLQDPAGAEDNFRLALENAPDLLPARLGLAQIYLDAGRDEDAFAEYRGAMNAAPDNANVRSAFELLRDRKLAEHRDSARAFAAEGDLEQTREAYRKALLYDPDAVDIHLALAEVLRSEDRAEEALTHLKTAADLEPEDTLVLKAYAEALFRAQQLEASLAVFEKVREKDPADRDAQARVETLKNRLGIFELPSQYGSIANAPVVSREDIAALIGVKFNAVLPAPSNRPPIIVDIATSWASRFIIRTASLGILEVYANHTFEPKKVVTRADMAETLLRLIGYLRRRNVKVIQTFAPEKIQVSDVPPEHVYYQPIVQVLAYQLMDVNAQRAFRPEQSLSGVEAIKALDLLLALIQ
ncbi:MAG: S-layer homology domain-containing protein [Candidatus Aminicenantes bacterium]|nr:S-layer homology domain-containing protein [Candidatus Aminicenantes bacterium]